MRRLQEACRKGSARQVFSRDRLALLLRTFLLCLLITAHTCSAQDAIPSFSSAVSGDEVGRSVALSDNGTVMATGAPGSVPTTGGKDQGAVYVHYRRTNGSWFQVAKLIVSPSPNYARLGTAVGIDRKGVRILAGAPGATGNTTIKGAAYIFNRCFGLGCSTANGGWVREATLTPLTGITAGEEYGAAVALHADGTVAAVGAPLRDINSLANSGAVFMFKRRGSIWARVGMLTASDLSSGDKFGYSLSIARDCVLAIGAPTAVGFGATSGAAYVFSPAQPCGNWTQAAKLSPRTDTDNYGRSVAISGSGMVLAVTHYHDSYRVGALFVYRRNSVSSWIQVARLTGAGTTITYTLSTGGTLSTATPDVGKSVVISYDGSLVATGTEFGYTYIFAAQKTATANYTTAYRPEKQGNNAYDKFGEGLSFSANGSTLAVGAYAYTPAAPIGLVSVYYTATSWSTTPTKMPSRRPTVAPTFEPTQAPTRVPTRVPTSPTTAVPTILPTKLPTLGPSTNPTKWPTQSPTPAPTSVPTRVPTTIPSVAPTPSPTMTPTRTPSLLPTKTPTRSPSGLPTTIPSSSPTRLPTKAPSQRPTRVPTTAPTPGPLATLSVASTSVYRASNTALPVVNVDDRLRLAMVGSNATVLTWRSYNFSTQALTQASLSPLASPYLSLGANTLLPGATYVFFVAPVLQPDLAIAKVIVRTNSPPKAGNVTASPYKGSAFSTVFTFRALGWNDGSEGDLPLHYQFLTEAGSLQGQTAPQALTGLALETRTEATFTPQSNVTVWVRVEDSLKASATARAPQSLNITAPALMSSSSSSSASSGNATAAVSLLLLDAVAQSLPMLMEMNTKNISTNILRIVGDIVKLNATIKLVNGDYLSSDMCFLLLGYMADQVIAQPVSVLAAMPTLAVAIVNQTKELVSGIGNLTSSRALAATSLLVNTVSGSATAGVLTKPLQAKALSALSKVAERVAEDSNKWTGKEQDKIRDTLLPSVMRGMSLLIQGGLLNQTAGSDKGSRNVESVQSVTSSLLDAALASQVPGEEPVSFQTATIGVSAMVVSQDTLLSATSSSSGSNSGSGKGQARVATADGGSSLSFGPSLLPQLGLDSSTLAAAKTISWRQDPPFSTNSTQRQQGRAWNGVTTFELQQQPSGRSQRGVPLSVHNLSEPLALVLPLAPPAITAVSKQDAGKALKGEVVSVRCRRGTREQLQVQCKAQDAVLSLNVSCNGTASYTRQYRCPATLPVCVFWDGAKWSSAGCRTVGYSSKGTHCQCNHLSHFSLLDSSTTSFVQVFMAANDIDPGILKEPKNIGILLIGGLIVLVFLLALYRTRLMEAERRNASLLLIRETRFYKSAMNFMKKVLNVKKAQDRIKVAMELTSFMPDLGYEKDSDPGSATEKILVQVLTRKRKRALLIKAGADASQTTTHGVSSTALANMPVLSFFAPARNREDMPSKASSVRNGDMLSKPLGAEGAASGPLISSGLLRSTGLLVEHSDMQRAFRAFLRVLTVLFLTVALHHVKADVAIGEILLATKDDAHESEDGTRVAQIRAALIGLYEYGVQRMLFRTPIILAIRILLYEINKESRQNLGVREELVMRNYGFINPLSMESTDPRYVSALRIAVVQLEMVERAVTQEQKRIATLGGSLESPPELAAVRRYLSTYRILLSEAYEIKVTDYLLSFELMGNEDESVLAKLRNAKRELGIRCMGKKRFLSGQLVEFTENPLTRFDEDVKLARAYDQWMLNHMGGGLRGLVLRLYFRLFVADLARTLQEGQFVGSRLLMLDFLLANYTICITGYICLFGITATTSTVYKVLGSFALTLLADLVLYQPVLDFVISKVNNRVSDAICRRLEEQVKPFLLLYRVGGLIEGGQAAAAALMKANAKSGTRKVVPYNSPSDHPEPRGADKLLTLTSANKTAKSETASKPSHGKKTGAKVHAGRGIHFAEEGEEVEEEEEDVRPKPKAPAKKQAGKKAVKGKAAPAKKAGKAKAAPAAQPVHKQRKVTEASGAGDAADDLNWMPYIGDDGVGEEEEEGEEEGEWEDDAALGPPSDARMSTLRAIWGEGGDGEQDQAERVTDANWDRLSVDDAGQGDEEGRASGDGQGWEPDRFSEPDRGSQSDSQNGGDGSERESDDLYL